MEPRTEDLLQALLAIWDELPRLLGRAWPTVCARLEWVVAHLDDGGPNPAQWLGRNLRSALVPNPAAAARFEEAVQAAGRGARPPVRTRGGIRGPRRPTATDTRSATTRELTGQLRRLRPPGVARFADVNSPNRVSADTPRFPVVVRLLARSTAHAPEAGQLTVREKQILQVHLEAPAFEVLGDAMQELEVRPDADSPPVVFDLRPRTVGDSFLTFDFFQDGNPVGNVRVPIACAPSVTDAPPRAPAELRLDMAAPPDLVLLIGTQVSPPALNLTLMRDGGARWRSFAPVPLTIDPASHVAGLYRHLTGLTVRADPAGTIHDPANNRVLSPYEIDRRVRDLGRNLWKDLIPQDFKDLYARERHQWRDRSLLVLSDDPHLPWELVWPYGEDWLDDEPWCCTLRLTRWLRRAGHGNGNDGPPSRLSLRALAVLAPHDADLPSVRQERNLLLSLAATHRLRDVSPGAATWPEVMRLLEQGDYDWLHIATHGKFHPTSPDGDTVVWLEDKATLSPATVVGPEIEGPIRRRRPAFLFNACDVGQQGWGLTGLAGWAARLLNVGAGLFAGPLWEITDDGALRFVDCFYREVLGGSTVAEAVQKARLRARRQGDPTWLAYSFYAHPNARVFSAPEVP